MNCYTVLTSLFQLLLEDMYSNTCHLPKPEPTLLRYTWNTCMFVHRMKTEWTSTNGCSQCFVLVHQPTTSTSQMLHTAHLLFSQSLWQRRNRSSSTSQLLLILSDGRGVFADGTIVSILVTLLCTVLTLYIVLYTQAIEVAIRTLNELGVLTVFIILDSLSKVSQAMRYLKTGMNFDSLCRILY